MRRLRSSFWASSTRTRASMARASVSAASSSARYQSIKSSRSSCGRRLRRLSSQTLRAMPNSQVLAEQSPRKKRQPFQRPQEGLAEKVLGIRRIAGQRAEIVVDVLAVGQVQLFQSRLPAAEVFAAHMRSPPFCLTSLANRFTYLCGLGGGILQGPANYFYGQHKKGRGLAAPPLLRSNLDYWEPWQPLPCLQKSGVGILLDAVRQRILGGGDGDDYLHVLSDGVQPGSSAAAASISWSTILSRPSRNSSVIS